MKLITKEQIIGFEMEGIIGSSSSGYTQFGPNGKIEFSNVFEERLWQVPVELMGKRVRVKIELV